VKRRGSRLGLFLCGALLLVASAELRAQQGPANPSGDGALDPLTGAFVTEVPIEVPEFRDITPALSLAYNSSSGNGWMGVGWGVSGSSFITRQSVGRGAPRFDATDIYLLDGMELVPCTELGGTHCTRIQNYARIKQLGGTWTVEGTNGNDATYAPLLETALGTVVWALQSMRDRHGNEVTYDYWCDPGTPPHDACYLGTLSYNQTQVIFHSELRPDPIEAANGSHIGVTRHRLSAVEVKVGPPGQAETARVYDIAYVESSNSGRSLVSSIQQYGRGATLATAADGTLTAAGPSLPAMTFGYPAVGDFRRTERPATSSTSTAPPTRAAAASSPTVPPAIPVTCCTSAISTETAAPMRSSSSSWGARSGSRWAPPRRRPTATTPGVTRSRWSKTTSPRTSTATNTGTSRAGPTTTLRPILG
jgi:hypothetical protein